MAAVAQVTALGKQVFDLTGRDLDLGFLGLAEFLPAITLMTVTGTVADRVDRRHVISVGLLGEAVSLGVLAWYSTSSYTATWPIFTLVVVFGTARAFVSPALRSMPADIAPRGGLPRLIAFNSAGWQAAIIVGPILAGFLFVVSPAWPFIACAALVLVGAVAIQFARPTEDHLTTTASIEGPASGALMQLTDEGRPAETLDTTGEAFAAELSGETSDERDATVGTTRQRRWHEAFEGFRVIRRNPTLLGAISLDLFAVLFGGAVALLPAIAERRLGVDAIGLGWLRAAGGIGAAAVTIALSVRPIRRRIGPTLFLVVAIFGVFTIVLGVTRSFVVAFIAMIALSAADSVSVFIRATLVPLVTPRAARGRVMAVEGVFIGASNELGAFESGVAGQLLGTGNAVVFGGVATLAVAGIWAVSFPSLSRFDTFPDHPPD